MGRVQSGIKQCAVEVSVYLIMLINPNPGDCHMLLDFFFFKSVCKNVCVSETLKSFHQEHGVWTLSAHCD